MAVSKGSLPDFVLTLSCADRRGISHGVTGALVRGECNILDSAQFGDPDTGLFFMRVHFAAEGAARDLDALGACFAGVAAEFDMDWNLWDCAVRPRVLILVSRFDHCLNDLLYRYRTGELDIEIPAVVSNHRDVYQLVAAHNIPFHYLPIDAASKATQEATLRALIDAESVDFVVLARYMQILSESFCATLPGRMINIHHSFLPGFKGAKPYHQAYARGVKLIGATAHYVTPELDEGPIIEQDVERVDHGMSPQALTAVGRDLEQVVLARAVRYQAERRVLLNRHKTVVFR
jgi:formyltetrahydrofolate deformylase